MITAREEEGANTGKARESVKTERPSTCESERERKRRLRGREEEKRGALHALGCFLPLEV